ncbi:alpha-glucuronidase family glycosyl hydrolase [Chitinophaga sp. 22321]|uniref:Xylan alpha-1,2-glucuronidase n=1 Tax=Chitinophaga hostae TaxID=2831022 RepID=A0ABS5J726_9BACT|nr:alpha-glucuronidase family glycosyl hydrolase [Chitinophaga hostae]MBS0031016.1 alpha-glucuronidase [Chitinophaga hostae]
MKKNTLLILCLCCFLITKGENGYDLWLRYKPVSNHILLSVYRKNITQLITGDSSATMNIIKNELLTGIAGLLQTEIGYHHSVTRDGAIIAGTPRSSALIRNAGIATQLQAAGDEGFVITTKKINGKQCILISGNSEKGVLYGAFHFLRLLQTEQPITSLHIVSAPKIRLRMLDHWDNPNRTVERGYAGFSIWNWHTLPTYIDQRYIDYARANASIGINGTVITNVNANAVILTPAYLEKVKALADVFRPYGIKVYLTARFSAPIEIGGLKTADPLDAGVQQWWREKIKEIYTYIPDFGGFLVKANSEGQPGPQDYKRSHADGANMLADAIAPFNGIIIWRAFVYSHDNPLDRHKQAYDDFVPLNGKFRDNVMVQVKNGAIDFMPREPFHPLFGAMPQTPLMMEFQVTQEYLGQGTSLVFLAPLFKETLESDTYYKGKGSTVAKVIDGTLDGHRLTGIAGVANIGNDINWCGHPFAQANWYTLGRLAWDPAISSEQIAGEWLRMTFSNQPDFLKTASQLMLESRDIIVQYSNPIGLHHIMGTGHHYGPAPWVSNQQRPEWNPVYYHKSDSNGIGFDRTVTGSNALAQYYPGARKQWENSHTCDEKYLLWFHHVPWNFQLKNGRNVWEELCFQYYTGAERAGKMRDTWNTLRPFVDQQRFEQVSMLLKIQHEEATWWRNACLLYFQTCSRLPIPLQYEKPGHTLEYYKNLRFPYAPGI